MQMEKKANRMKILAPVGGQAQLLAAVRCGADAVYLGAKGFNARRNADNFDGATLGEAVAYCHERDVEVHVTLNTLVMDGELPALCETLDEIASAGADAVIVQDLAVARLIWERYPELPMHASTQMTVHNRSGAQAALEMGFSQVVLARELSLPEIGAIHEAVPIRLETFVHGALCMCVSGACYLSSVIGGRSGNRGLCAQPCRTDFRLDGKPYALSLKDMTGVQHMGELAEAGVTTLKIEGRMKRPEYVAAAVTACRAALAGEEPDMETLRAVFSRGGFTDGFLTGRRTGDMFGHRTKEDVTAAGQVLEKLARTYEKEPARISVDMTFTARENRPALLTASDGMHTAEVTGYMPEQAIRLPMTEQSVEKNLAQTGGTPYYVTRLQADLGENLSLPVSAQKAMRREALDKLALLRQYRPPYGCTGWTFPTGKSHSCPETPGLRLRFEKAEQAFDAPEDTDIILPAEVLAENPSLIQAYGDRLICELPALCFPDRENALWETLQKLRELGVARALAGNIGLVRMGLEAGMAVSGDYGLNILNGVSLAEYAALGLTDATVSFELSAGRISRLGGTLPRGVLAYGYLPLMKMRACPARGESCGPCGGLHRLTDSKRQPFTLLCRQRAYTELLNGVPLYIGDKPMPNVDFYTLRFTTESREAAAHVWDLFKAAAQPDFPRTNGLYYRELL